MHFWENPDYTTQEIAKKLLGHLIVMESKEGPTSGFIVETEAYLGEIDQAAHSFEKRRTPRLKSMYKEAGTVYVYQMHTQSLLNLVVQEKEIPEAILIRAIEPLSGIEYMQARRKRPGIELTNGPGKLTQAMNISKECDGTKLNEGPLYLLDEYKKEPKEIKISERIGIPNKGKWTDALLRYSVKGNPFVSKALKKEMVPGNGWIE